MSFLQAQTSAVALESRQDGTLDSVDTCANLETLQNLCSKLSNMYWRHHRSSYAAYMAVSHEFESRGAPLPLINSLKPSSTQRLRAFCPANLSQSAQYKGEARLGRLLLLRVQLIDSTKRVCVYVQARHDAFCGYQVHADSKFTFKRQQQALLGAKEVRRGRGEWTNPLEMGGKQNQIYYTCVRSSAQRVRQ